MCECSLAAETLAGAYPPPPTEKMPAAWLLRTLAQRIDHAPKSRLRAILSVLVEPLATWIRDDEAVYSDEDCDVSSNQSYPTQPRLIPSLCL